MNPTAQQALAIEKQGTVLVSASAGSGKTSVMIERLVAAVKGGADVSEVLAVTFTNKAAAQMRERLRKAIIEGINHGEKGLAVQLERLPLSDISTIHAFCGKLVRTNFFLAGVDAAFRVVSPDDAEGKALVKAAIEETFEQAYARGDAAFKGLLAVYFRRKKDAKLKEIVLSLYFSVRELADYRAVIARIGTEDCFGAAADLLKEDFFRRLRFLREGIEERKQFFAEHNLRALRVGDAVETICGSLLQAGDLFELIGLAAEPLSVPTMPPMTKAVGEELAHLRFLSGASKEIKAIWKELREFKSREEEAALCRDAQARARALADLVAEFDGFYTEKKREAGVLDYNDLEHCALAVLENADARAQALERYRYIFVDEYQDVNPIQERILSLLAGENVFMVGDAKQAIYGFRGSRSQYFEEKREELAEEGGALSLTENFRSAPAVLEAVNLVFTPLIPGYEPMKGGSRYQKEKSYAGEVRFHRVGKEASEPCERGVYSVMEQTPEEKTDALAERVADEVARETLLRSTWFDADESVEKQVKFGDIAILARKNTGDMERIVRALSRQNIPVVTTAKVNVCDFFEARLLIDWFSYLDNAMQDIPLATAMLSAVGGFSESELAEIRLRAAAFPEPPYTFRECAELMASKGEDELSGKVRAFFALSEDLRAQAQVKTASEMAGLLLSLGLEAQIASKREGALRLLRVRRLVSESEGCANIHAFLSHLRDADFRVEYAEGGGDCAVKVLTMHASKGLEFPVVMLAGLDAPFHGADRDDVMWTEQFLAAPRSFDLAEHTYGETLVRRASAVLQEREELVGERNLLYVAMTRARYRLHLFFSEREHALSPDYARRFSDFFDLSLFSQRFTDEEALAPPLQSEALIRGGGEKLTERILSAYGKPYPYAASVSLPVKSSATQLMNAEALTADSDPEFEGAGGSIEEGLAYHAFLEHVDFSRDAGSELVRMREEGILTPSQLALLDEKKLRAILAMPAFSALAGKKLYREQKFLVKLPARELFPTEAEDAIVCQGAIDLLIEDEEGYTILDYKYSGKSDEALKEHYGVQIALYKAAVERAFSAEKTRIGARIVNIARLREIKM